MTIHNLKAYVAALWDWGAFDACFKYGCKISDVDGTIERKGHFLIIEAKGPNTGIPDGQFKMFRHRVNRGDMILVLWGETNKPERMMIWYPYESKPLPHRPATIVDVSNAMRAWFDWADANGNVPGAGR